jgi:hypothetical protein
MKYAYLKRTEREFNIEDMVYLRLQPFTQNALGLHKHLKLPTKYYCPFRVLERIGLAAYKIQLPANVDIQPVFHVNQLKRHWCQGNATTISSTCYTRGLH